MAGDDAQDLLAEALSRHQADELEAAERLYRRILAAAPGHGAALANLGMLFHQRRALEEAERWYGRALAAARTPEVLSNLAILRREQGDLAAAERLLQEALRLRPAFPDALYNLGVTLLEAGRPAEALAPLLERARQGSAGADVHANLARALAALGRRDEALDHGRQALLRKDQEACAAFAARGGLPLAEMPAPPFDASAPQSNIVAFSLWGSARTYVEGALANAALVRSHLPGWRCRVYLDETVPAAAIAALREAGAELIRMAPARDNFGLFWRFLAADDPGVRYFLCRDADARISRREAAAVAQWLASGRTFHIMRDAPFHTELILAGLWGGVGGRLGGIKGWIERFYRPGQHRWIDQDFLRLEIWPRIRGQALIHDGCYDLFGARPFPPGERLVPPDHVGAGHRL